MPEICKSDHVLSIRYLEGALKFYRRSTSTLALNRIRLIKLHIQKLKSKLDND